MKDKTPHRGVILKTDTNQEIDLSPILGELGRLVPKQRAWVIEYLKTGNGRQATRNVYNAKTPAGIKQWTYELRHSPRISLIIDEAMKSLDVTPLTVISNYNDLMKQRKSLSVAKSATDSVAKMMGIDKPAQETQYIKEQNDITNAIYGEIIEGKIGGTTGGDVPNTETDTGGETEDMADRGVQDSDSQYNETTIDDTDTDRGEKEDDSTGTVE
jgi:hypothetical protein